MADRVIHISIKKLPKRSFRVRLLLLAFLCTSFSCFAQLSEPQPKFRNYTVDDGLPGSETYFVHQDQKGYIWICTDRGVSRFDGYKFENFTMAEGLTDNVVFKIYEDYKGRIWFITYNSMLCYFENGKIHAYKYNHLIKKSLKVVKVAVQKNIYIDRNDKFYISLEYDGFFTIDKNGVYTGFDNNCEVVVKKIDDQMMWIFDCNNYGIGPVGRKISIKYFDGTNTRKIADLMNDYRLSLAKLGNEDLLLNSSALYSLTTGKKILDEHGAIHLSAHDNTLWIGSYQNGVISIPDIRYPEKKSRFLKNLSVTSVLCDSEGGYWFTTLEKGVFYSPSLYIQNYTMLQGLIDDDIVSITGIKNDIYVGFRLQRWQNMHNPAYIDNVPKGPNSTQLGSSRKRFYISTDHSYQLEKGKLINSFDFYWSPDYYLEKDGTLLQGVRNLRRLYDNGKVEMVYSYPDDKGIHRQNLLQTIMSDAHKRLWVGCISGLFYVDGTNMSTKGLKDPLFRARVSDLLSDPNWKNVVATRGEGIYFFDNNKILRQIKKKDGLLSDLVNVMFIDENGGLWVGTNKGLNYITKDSEGHITVEAFTTLHGLVSNEISCIYVYDGLAYVGTKGGLSVINTRLFRRNKSTSNVYVTLLETATHKLDPTIHHVLGFQEAYIKINFRNSNYRTLKNGAFRYRFSKQSPWVTTETPEISLINPLPGEYNLEIRYENEDGIWSAPQLVCSFTIDEAFYNKWYFFTAVALLLALIGWRIFRMRIKQLKRRHQMNNKINQLEQKALQAQMNPHFIFNALNSIQSFLVYEENDKAEKYLLKFAQLIRQTLVNSRDLYITIENEIGILEKYLDLERMRFRNKFSYRIENEIPPTDNPLRVPNMLIQPFVENAVLHGFSTLDSGGKISILFKPVDTNQILCIIEDNGVGRKQTMQQSAKKHVSFGTTITEERLKAFETKHGIHLRIETIDIENADGTTGTRVLINLPLI